MSHKVYMPGKKGPFKCSNCEYYNGINSCNQPEIMRLARLGWYGLSMNGKFAKVDPEGCSDYYEPKD